MRFTKDHYAAAGRTLEFALTDTSTLSPESVAQARAIHAVALAGQRRLGDAMQAVDASVTAPVERQVTMLDALVRLALPAEYEVRQGELALRVVQRVEPRVAQLSATERRVFGQSRAAALALAGDKSRALAEYEQLVAQFPNDGELHESIAAILADSSDPVILRQALAKTREIQRRSPAPSPLWFRAQLLEVQCLIRLGEAGDAVKLIEVTRILHPDLGGPEAAARFAELLIEAGGR
jgi:hypothetical protein